MRVLPSLLPLVLLSLTGAARADSAPDPAAGYDYLVNGNYIPCGLPLTYMERTSHQSDRMPRGLGKAIQDVLHVPNSVEGVFGDPGIPGRTGLNANVTATMSVFRSSRGNLVMNNNCLYCHSQKLGGKVIVGLGNSTADFTGKMSAGLWLLRDTAKGAAEKVEIDTFADILAGIGPYVSTRVRGVNPAINLTYALMAHRDPKTLAWSKENLIEPPARFAPPVDVPPWWRMKKRKTMFYAGGVSGEIHRIMMLASIMCVDDPAAVPPIDAAFRDVEAYIRSIEPPKYPHAIDQQLADKGNGIFVEHCAGCHGTYGRTGEYPERLVPIDVVGTDPSAIELETGIFTDRFGQWLAQSLYGEQVMRANQGGYVAPALDGIWATGPFLHNGSVPTLEGVLNSHLRPKYWTRSFDPADYDTVNMGWKYQELKTGQAGIANIFRKSRVYDTTLPGYSNEGHLFGDALAEDERMAVLEYLKTL
jgi:mono/diheme cytochrome c family protein